MKKKTFLLSAVILFHPVVSIFDILPDFLAYLLFMKAMKNPSYLYDKVADAYESAKKMALITFAKFLCMFLTISSSDTTLALVFSFSFAIAELIYGISFFSKFFGAISYLNLRNETGPKKDESDKACRYTIAFFVAHHLLSALPDFSLLGSSTVKNLSVEEFRTLFLTISAFVSLIVGTVWLVSFIRYLNRTLTKDLVLILQNDFDRQVKERPALVFSKDMMTMLTFFCFGTLFLLDFSADGVSILPSGVLSVVCAVFLWMQTNRGYYKKRKSQTVFYSFAVAHFLLGIVKAVFENRFHSRYYVINVPRFAEAKRLYLPVRILSGIDSLFGIVLIGLLVLTVYETAINDMRRFPQFYAEHDINAYLEDVKPILKQKALLTFCLLTFCQVFSFLTVMVNPYYEEIIVANFILHVIGMINLIKYLLFFSDNVYKKMNKYA